MRPKKGIFAHIRWIRLCGEPAPTMASIYQRPDSRKYQLSCYPRPGAKVLRASLDTDDEKEAKKVAHAVELLIELEKLGGIKVPQKLLAALPGVRSLIGSDGLASAPTSVKMNEFTQQPDITQCSIDHAISALINRSFNGENAHHATLDKISRFRQFFGPERIDALDPRPESELARRRKVKAPECWFKKDKKDPNEEKTYSRGDELSAITADLILEFFTAKKYGRSSKRHYRELFHELFQLALRNGTYVPANPYAANPTDELPSYQGKDGPVIVLGPEDEVTLYKAVVSDSVVHFGCQIMIEAGFRLHEILALKRCDLDIQRGKILLRMPDRERVDSTGLKTGERTVTMRAPMRRMIEVYLEKYPGRGSEWCIPGNGDRRMTSDAFGKKLRELMRNAGLEWTTQDFRHTFATNRISEGWNLKVLAQEMGTSIAMLMEHYAGYIEPPVLASTLAS